MIREELAQNWKGLGRFEHDGLGASEQHLQCHCWVSDELRTYDVQSSNICSRLVEASLREPDCMLSDLQKPSTPASSSSIK